MVAGVGAMRGVAVRLEVARTSPRGPQSRAVKLSLRRATSVVARRRNSSDDLV